MRGPAARGTTFDAVDDFIEREYIATGRLAGAQLAILHQGILHEARYGHMDRERTRPMPGDAMFRIFSMTKPITCLGFMMLVEEGLIGLDDAVERYIPAWSDLKVAGMPGVGRRMRVVDLMSHTSGLTYGIQYRTDIDAKYRSVLSMRADGQSLEEFIAALAGLPLEFEPGTAWKYSVATDVLGYLIEKISGQPFAEFLDARIFQPLGMIDTAFSIPAAKRQRLVECYVRRSGELLGLPGPGFETDLTRDATFLSGGGGLISTVSDYMNFCEVMVHQGRRGKLTLLSKQSMELMSTNHLPMGKDLPAASKGLFSDPSNTGIGFGLGWATTIDKDRVQVPGNTGDIFWSGMANTFFWCDPREELACVFMTQLLPSETYPLQRQVKTLVYDALDGLGSSHRTLQAVE